MQDSIRLWDGPLRVFHWLLAGSVSAALLTGWLGGGWMVWHGRLGLLVLGLLVFRLLWGLLGSTYARWSRLICTLAGMRQYLAGRWTQAGHNPLGVLSVLGMLGMLAVQVSSGLAASDDIAFRGPWQLLASRETSELLTRLHRLGQWLVVGLIGLHLAAIMLYALRGKRLVPAMLHGRAARSHAAQQDARGGSWWLALLAIGLALLVVWLVQAAPAWLAPPPPAAAPVLNF